MLTLHTHTPAKRLILAVGETCHGSTVGGDDASLQPLRPNERCYDLRGKVLAVSDEHGREAVVSQARPQRVVVPVDATGHAIPEMSKESRPCRSRPIDVGRRSNLMSKRHCNAKLASSMTEGLYAFHLGGNSD